MNTLKKAFTFGKYLLYFVVSFILLMLISYFFTTASNDLAWEAGQQKTASVDIDKDQLITIKNVRDFDWQKFQEAASTVQNYKKLQFHLRDLKSVQVAVSHFSSISEIAHVFLMFELHNQQRFGFSIEARRQEGEEYSLLGGLFARFELIYLFATEEDLIGVRTQRDEKVYLYPIKSEPRYVQKLFKLIARKTNHIAEKPQLYHLFVKNCTTQIVELVEQIADQKYPRIVQSFMPGDAGLALFKMGLIETKETQFEAVQQAALIK